MRHWFRCSAHLHLRELSQEDSCAETTQPEPSPQPEPLPYLGVESSEGEMMTSRLGPPAHLAGIGRGSCAQIFMTSSRMLVPSKACRRQVISYRTHLSSQSSRNKRHVGMYQQAARGEDEAGRNKQG